MLPWEHLDTAPVPGSRETLRLIRRGSEFAIMLGNNPLMNSRLSGSEEALATLVCTRLADRPLAQLLIGGLGMGFTLRAALGLLGPRASVAVAELVPAVIAWAHGPMAEVHGPSLTDTRVRVTQGDVGAIIRAAKASYDAILLDVDNGPDGLTRKGNDALYAAPGLRAARAALKPGGILAVWSVAPDDAFVQRLAKAGFSVEAVRIKAHKGRSGTRHVIWLATRS